MGEEGRVAILSDVHGNLEALLAVFEDIKLRNYEVEKGRSKSGKISRIWFLGDAVGYGANPVECLELLRNNCEIVLAGNHEIAARTKINAPSNGLVGFSGLGAVRGIHWTARQMYGDATALQKDDAEMEKYTLEFIQKVRSADYRARCAGEISETLLTDDGVKLSMVERMKGVVPRRVFEALLADTIAERKIASFYQKLQNQKKGDELLAYMQKLPVKHEKDGVLLVHDNEESPGDMRYMLEAEDSHLSRHSYVINDVVYERLKKQGIARLFFGHSHRPGEYSDSNYKGIKIVNVGSVGIPRGESFSSTYAIWNPAAKSNDVTIVELELADWKKTAEKMVAAGLPNKLSKAHDHAAQGMD